MSVWPARHPGVFRMELSSSSSSLSSFSSHPLSAASACLRALTLFLLAALVLAPLASDCNVCSVNICQNGTCYEQGGFKICVCTPPYTGTFCDQTISMCSNACGIRPSSGIDCSSALCSLGTCVDTSSEPFYKCECGDFFTGKNCETPNNPCTSPANNACGHGTCTFSAGKGSGVVTCECEDDWEPPPGSSSTKIRWGDSEVLQAPACTNRRTKGIAALPFSLSSGELVLWWSVFALALLTLVACCYSVLTESCGRAAKAWKLFGAAKKAAT